MFRYTFMVQCDDQTVRRIRFASLKVAIHFARNDMWRGNAWRIVDDERLVVMVDHAAERAYAAVL